MSSYILNQYASVVDEAISTEIPGRVIGNDSREHAKIVISKMIETAKEEILILCHRLAREVYGCDDITKAIEKAYKENANLKVKVYIREKSPNLTPFLLSILIHGAELHCNVDSPHGDVIVVDQKFGREETDPVKRTGSAHFHDPEWGKNIANHLFSLA